MHDYDPPDLMTSFTEASADKEDVERKEVTPKTEPMKLSTPVKAKELEEAEAAGVLIDFQAEQRAEEGSPISVLSACSGRRSPGQNVDDDLGQGVDSDNDDDDDDLL